MKAFLDSCAFWEWKGLVGGKGVLGLFNQAEQGRSEHHTELWEQAWELLLIPFPEGKITTTSSSSPNSHPKTWNRLH